MSRLVLPALLLCTAALFSCAGQSTCDASMCAGCCDAYGVCQTGEANNACGRAGLACDICEGANVCLLQMCVVGTGGGNQAGGPGGAGGVGGSGGSGGSAGHAGGSGGGTAGGTGGTGGAGGGHAGGTGGTGGGTAGSAGGGSGGGSAGGSGGGSACSCNTTTACTGSCSCDPDCQTTISCGTATVDSSSVGTTNSLLAIGLSGDDGWAAGSSGALLKLTQGVFSARTAPTGNFAYSITDLRLTDANNGYAVCSWASGYGDYGCGLKLANGTWTLSMDSMGWALKGLDMVDATNGMAVGSAGQVTKIVNGVYTPMFPGYGNTTMYGIDLIDMSNGWAVGSGGAIHKLTNGTWSTVTSPTSNTLSSVVLTDLQTGWAVGAYGTVLRLSQGSWSVVPAVTNRSLSRVTLAPNGTVWAVGEAGTVLRNAGTWGQCSYGAASDPSLYAVAASATSVWSVGSSAHRRRLSP